MSINASRLGPIVLTAKQALRLKAWIKAQPQKKFPSAKTAVQYLKREFARG
jgi:hypothetical protein